MNDLKMVMRIKDIHRALFALCSARFFIIFTHNSPPLLVDAMTIDSVVIIIIRKCEDTKKNYRAICSHSVLTSKAIGLPSANNKSHCNVFAQILPN